MNQTQHAVTLSAVLVECRLYANLIVGCGLAGKQHARPFLHRVLRQGPDLARPPQAQIQGYRNLLRITRTNLTLNAGLAWYAAQGARGES